MGVALASVLAIVLLAGCDKTLRRTAADDSVLDRLSEEPAPLDSAQLVNEKTAAQFPGPASPNARLADDELEQGTGAVLAAPDATVGRRTTGSERDVVLNFQRVDIHEFVKVVLGDMLKLNYIVDPAVTGTVTTETSAGLSKADLLPVVEALLRHNGAAMVHKEGVIEIVPAAKASLGRAAQLRPGTSASSHYVRIYPLKFVGALEMEKILTPMLAEGALVYVDEKRNLLILAGTSGEQRSYDQTIRTFDINWMDGMSVGIFRLKFATPSEMAKQLEEVFGKTGAKPAGGGVRFVELERTNALLGISPSAEALREVREWVRRLDVAGDTTEPQLFVLRLQNAKAVDVAAILSEALDGDGALRRPPPDVELAPGNLPVVVESPDARPDRPGGAPAPPGMSVAGGQGTALPRGTQIRVIPDEKNNALVILGTPREYELIYAAVQKLDLVPLQVLIETTIVEVTLNDALEYGVEWFFKNGLGSDKQGQGLLDLGSPGLATTAPAFSYAVLDGIGDVRVVVNALETESEVNVLSSPSLLVLDNQTASINVGDEIPVPTRQSVSNIDPDSPTVNEIQFRNTGVTLKVMPRINAGGLVTMEIDQEVSDAIATTSSELDAPTIQQRHISSSVAVQSGQTIVLGGLIREVASTGGSGVPYLRQIPYLGKLFGQTNESTQRTELLVLITPTAIGDSRDARSVSREYAEKMRALQ